VVTCWLYASDGRALYHVAIPLPMPQTLSFSGHWFVWDSGKQKYVQSDEYMHGSGGKPASDSVESSTKYANTVKEATEADFPK
jgi:hypothetical protein